MTALFFTAIMTSTLLKNQVVLAGENRSLHSLDDFFFLEDDEITFEPSTSFHPSSSPTSFPSIFPTLSPSEFLSSAPSVEASNSPSILPSSVPTQVPTHIHSSSPSYSLQEFIFFLDLEFDEFRDRKLDKYSKQVFEDTLEALVSNSLKKLPDYDFSVDVRVNSYTLLVEKNNSVRRRSSLHQLRRAQQLNAGLRILVDLYVSLRSEETLDPNILSMNIKSSLDSRDKREEFIFNLQQSDTTFYPINALTMFKINDEEVRILSYESRRSVMYLSLGLSFCVALISCGAYISFRLHQRFLSDDKSPGQYLVPACEKNNLE